MFQSGLALCALSGPLLHRLNLSVFVLFYFDESRSAQRKSVMARVFVLTIFGDKHEVMIAFTLAFGFSSPPPPPC